jgi:hypothetical protein
MCGETWRVLVRNESSMVAKQVPRPTPARLARVRAAVRVQRRLAQDAPTVLVPFVDSFSDGDAVWLLRAFDAGVPLARIAAHSSLGHTQVVRIAAAVMLGLRSLHSAGQWHGGLRSTNVFVELDGTVRLVDAGIARVIASGRGRTSPRAADVAGVASLVDVIWPQSRRRRAPALSELLDSGRLARAASVDEALDLLRGAMPDATALDAGDLGARDAALAAVAARLVHRPAVGASPSHPLETALPSPPRPFETALPPPPNPIEGALPSQPSVAGSRAPRVIREDAGRLDHARSLLTAALKTQRRARLRRWLVAAAGVMALLAGAGIWLGTHVGGEGARRPPRVAALPAPSVTNAPVNAPRTPVPSPAPANAVIQPTAPSSAGFINQAQISSLGSCGPGPCTIRTVFALGLPHPGEDITWQLVAVDRCTAAQTVLGTSSIATNSSWVTAWRTDEVTIPTGDPLLLYAVTVSPWRMASAPLAVGGSEDCAHPA